MSDSEVDLVWHYRSGISKYRIQHRLSADSSWPSASTTVTGTSHTVSNLSYDTGYDFRIAAFGDGSTFAAQWGPYSSDSATTVPKTLVNVSEPTGLAVEMTGSSTSNQGCSAKFTWDVPTGAVAYEYEAVLVGNEGDSSRIPTEPPHGPENEHIFYGLWCSTEYQFRVMARGNGSDIWRGEEQDVIYTTEWSGWATHRATTAAYTPINLDPPTPSRLTLEALDDGTIKATWDEQTGIDSYDLGHRVSGTIIWTRLADELADHTFTTAKLDCTSEYEFRIRGYGNETKYRLGPSDWVEESVRPECVLEFDVRLTLRGNTILNVLHLNVIEDDLVVVHIEESTGQTIPESYRFRLSTQPDKTGAEIAPSDRKCKWNGSSQGMSHWFGVPLLHSPAVPSASRFAESVRVLRCHLGDWTGYLKVEAQDGPAGVITTLASWGPIAEAEHQHMVNGTLTLTFIDSFITLARRENF